MLRKTLLIASLLFGPNGCGETIVENHYLPTGSDIKQSEISERAALDTIFEETEQELYLGDACKTKTFFPDKDNDGYGDNDLKNKDIKKQCERPEHYSENHSDCNDSDFGINPSALEICDLLDNNCVNGIDEDLDCCSTSGEVKDIEYCPPYDFVFAIDNSGSMDSSDPEGIRYKGLFNLVEQIGDNDRGLIIYFNSTPTKVGYFTSNKTLLTEFIEEAKNSGNSGYTNISGSVKLGIEQYEDNQQKRALILLTDGYDTEGDYSPNYLKQEAQKKEIKVFTLGLGSEVDESYLKQFVTYDGGYYFIGTANQIPQVYDEIIKGLKLKSYKECSQNFIWVERYNNCGD